MGHERGLMSGSDLTFITNEGGQNLKERFRSLITDTKLFDCLVGYFYVSGFHEIYKSLENTKKVRILIGINTNKDTYDLIKQGEELKQASLQFSHAEVKEEVEGLVTADVEESEDNQIIESGISKFIEWIKSGKLEIKAYPSEKIHAKLYIMTFAEDDRDKGRVITGSSNFSKAGLIDNLEFNVELKMRSDYDFALEKFNELWRDSVDVSEKYVETIQNKTWLNDEISPHDLYLKLLYEYFKDDLGRNDEIFIKYLPEEFKKLEYQEQAVLNAKKILEEYGGVFISDVVGLGKTYVSAMLAGQLTGRTLVIAPPVLLEKENPGSWPSALFDFGVRAVNFESIGKLDHIIKQGTDKYDNVIIDEAHRFRTETTATYEKLAEICRGKRVVLVTATPYNNSPKDILSQIKLFQNARKSTIPNLPDLERFFTELDKKLKDLDRQEDHDEYIKLTKENAKEIREKVLKYLMVRRTRTEIIKYFKKDLDEQKLKFPDVEKPKPVFYELSDVENKVFEETIRLVTKEFHYSRYMPMLYYKGKLTQPEELSQMNMGKFMKILLIKRLESSFYAFKNTLDRFIHSYEQFLEEFDKGDVYVSKKYSTKIFELLENDDDAAIQRLIDEGKADKFSSKEFRPELVNHLHDDLATLEKVRVLWTKITRDPKFLTFAEIFKTDSTLRDNKVIIFTESKETAEYLEKNLNEELNGKVIAFTGGSGAPTREKVIENFDAKSRFPKDDYRVLVSTEVLAEGVNLHRSNVVVNYDIPWNPTRMMQRVGRINRVDTKFEKIYTYNFFPTVQSNNQIKLKEAAESKISAFLTLLGDDAPLLTEGEPVGSHELFDKLTSKASITGEENEVESELKYLNVIKEIRDNNPALFERIKRLPKKARTAKSWGEKNSLLTYFRKGKVQKFFESKSGSESLELGFMDAASMLETRLEAKREKIPTDFYEKLNLNKQAFIETTTEELIEVKLRGGRDSATRVLRIIKASIRDLRQFTEDQELYLRDIMKQLEEGGLPKQTTKKVLQALNEDQKSLLNPLKVFAILEASIPKKLLSGHLAEEFIGQSGKREVILSEYLIRKK